MINNNIRDGMMGNEYQNTVVNNDNRHPGYGRDAMPSAGNDKMSPEMHKECTIGVIAKGFTIRNNPQIILERYPTGFSLLDKNLGGGITKGITIIQAMSSTGKTTLTLQMAGQMAEAGKHVIYITTEMSKEDLVAKMISRQSYRLCTDGDYEKKAVDVGQLMSVEYHKNASAEEWERVIRAAKMVSDFDDKITFLDNSGAEVWSIDVIARFVEAYIRYTGVKPVVVIDYLQILPSPEEKNFVSEKQAIDDTIRSARKISNVHKIPVVMICSVNRESYKKTTGMGSGKGSGDIEYSADLLLGLQYKGFGEDNFDEYAAMAKDIREMELVVIKQRNGAIGSRIPFDFYARYNNFEEVSPRGHEELKEKSSTSNGKNSSVLKRSWK